MSVVVSWPGGVFPGASVIPTGGKRKNKTRKGRKGRKTTRKSGTRKSRCWSRRG